MARKIIIDADPGIGDALAISLAVLSPKFDLLAVTATAGVVSGRSATRNVQAIVELLDPPKHPRIGASLGPSSFSDETISPGMMNLAQLQGADGLGNISVPPVDLHNRHESAKLMVELAREFPNEITLLTLGPLTNVVSAYERDTEFINLLQNLVCLGGTIQAGGDVTAAAEFNMYANPEAARSFFSWPATKVLVPLDVSQQTVLTFDFMQDAGLTNNRYVERVFQPLIAHGLQAYHEQLGQEGLPLPEVTALFYVDQFEQFRLERMTVDAETQGTIARGATIFDRRNVPYWQTNIDVVTEVDTDLVLDFFRTTIKQAK